MLSPEQVADMKASVEKELDERGGLRRSQPEPRAGGLFRRCLRCIALLPKTRRERRLTMVEALREALREEMRRDQRVILLGEDIGVPGGFGGAFTVTLGLEEGIWTRARARYADFRSCYRRSSGRRGHGRIGSRSGRAIRRFFVHRHGPVCQPGRQDALHVRRQAHRAHGLPRACRRDYAAARSTDNRSKRS